MNEKEPTNKMKKPTLLSIRQQQTFISTEQLAKQAGVSITEAYVVEIGGFADKEIATKVITAFSQLSGKAYTLDDIRFQNVPSSQTSSSNISRLH